MLIDPLQNVVTINVPADAEPSDFATHSRWRFSSTYQTLSPTNDLAPNEFPPDGEVEDHIVFISNAPDQPLFDYGDAPDSYQTTVHNAGPSHLAIEGVHLGLQLDAELDGQPEIHAFGDDLAGVNDDDGVLLLEPMYPGGSVRFEVSPSTQGWLNGWIDFDGDGTFGAHEKVADGLPVSPLDFGFVAVDVPSDAQAGETMSRWRFSSTYQFLAPINDLDLNQFPPDGEVEDHAVLIQELHDPDLDCIDFEDAFDGAQLTPNTTMLEDRVGFQAVIVGESFTAMDGTVIANGNAQIGTSGNSGGNGQDLGLFGITVGFDFGRTLSGLALNFGEFGGNINVEVNGDFRVVENFHDLNGLDVGGVRLIVTGGNGNDQGVFQVNGEVRSFKIGGQELWIDQICETVPDLPLFDYGDAPESYRTSRGNNGPAHLALADVYLGAELDAEFDGQPSMNSNGDDAAGANDEDGVLFIESLRVGQSSQIQVVPSTAGWINGWIDFDRNGIFDNHEKVADGVLVDSLQNVISVNVPADVEASDIATYSRWRFSSTYQTLSPVNDLEPNQFPPDGEVEDHLVFIDAPMLQEWGDAPGRYPTLSNQNGAHHAFDQGVMLGDRIDAETDGQPTPNGDGDDVSAQDDDDGINFLTTLTPGQDARVEVTTSTSGWLNAWIDFNADARWDVAPSPESVVVSRHVDAGTTVVNFRVPDDAKVDPETPTFSRWRFTTDTPHLTPEGGAENGLVPNGEVEDHPALIVYAAPRGDINNDGTIDTRDIGQVCSVFGRSGSRATDLNGDGSTDQLDLDILVHDILKTHYGDANLDRTFNSTDLIQVFSGGKYETGASADWSAGDFNCDGQFDSSDLIAAFRDGAYTNFSRAEFGAVVDALFSDDLDDRKLPALVV